MNLFKWDQRYSVGIDEIDAQHLKLVKIINKLATKLSKNTRDDIKLILDEMIDYTMHHFSHEEENYLCHHPNFMAHKKHHREFIDKTIELHRGFVEEKEDPLVILKYLITWLQNHILETDKKYFADLAKT